MSEKIVVLGGGSWGATLANLLAKNGHSVCLWEFLPEQAKTLRETRKLAVIPQLSLHESVLVTSDLVEALTGRPIMLSAVPSEHVRATFGNVRRAGALARDAWVISATKGIENDTLKLMTEIIMEEVPALTGRAAALSGPSHAEEVAQGVPTAVVSAGPGRFPEEVQRLFTGENFRVYTSSDFIGVELGGALKNIYAIACGICDGLGLGDNTKAALMARGLNEMARLGHAAGARATTFFGLSGLGDLIVTCSSRHSRNRQVGEKIGQGKTLSQALSEMTMVAEGVRTTKSARQLARRYNMDLPIVEELSRCLFEGKPAKDSLRDLMHRPVSDEMEQVELFIRK